MDEKRMPIAGHLVELRHRLIICLVAVLVGMVVGFYLCPDVFYPIIRAPLDAVRGDEADNPFLLRTPLLDLLSMYRSDGPAVGVDGPPPGVLLGALLGHIAERRAAPPGAAPRLPDPLLWDLAGYLARDAAGVRPVAANTLHFLSPTDALVMRLKVSLIVGIILMLPVVLYEVWAFVASGLYTHERRYVLVYGPASFALFILGAALGYFVVLPLGVFFLLEQGQTLGLQPMLTITEYAPFVMWLLLGFGIVFQMPLVVLFLTRLGVLGPDKLTQARPYAVLGMFVVAGFITPPDIFTMIAMAVPMLALYEFSILLSRVALKRVKAGSK